MVLLLGSIWTGCYVHAKSMGVRAERLVQARIVRLEMAREPGVQPPRQIVGVDRIHSVEFVHDVADLVEQAFVIVLVLPQLVIAALAHEPFLEREMGRYPLEQIAKKAFHRQFRAARRQLVMQTIDQIDQFLVLVIDRGDADAVLVLPLQQCHDTLLRADQRNTNPPLSGRKSITNNWSGARATRPLRSWSKPSVRGVSRRRTAISWSPAGTTNRSYTRDGPSPAMPVGGRTAQ